MTNGTIHAIGKGKCNPSHARNTVTIIEQEKPQNDNIFGVNPYLIKNLTGRSTNLFNSLR